MSTLLKYSGITTKVRAMQSRLLTKENFEEISNLRNTPEVISYLKQTPGYSHIFNDNSIHALHRLDVEKMLDESLFKDYARLYAFASLDIKNFLKIYVKRYETDLINYCSRIVFNHYREPFDLEHKKAFFNKYSQISIERLVTARSIADLVEALKDTEYYEPLKKVSDNPNPSLYDFNLALDLYYFSSIWKERKKIVKKLDLEMFTKTYGSRIDLLNMQWIYRAKKYYRLSSSDIYAMLIPVSYRLKADAVKSLIEAETLEEFMEIAGKTYYARKYDFDSAHTIEHLYKDCLNHLYMAEKRKHPYSLATINSYLFAKEQEIEKLTTALECIHYGLSSKETLEYAGGVIR